ncbi:MAG: GatB/YqeY domain-containing protein [Gammaproteobacteria bacterium]
MSLKARLGDDMKQALRAGDKHRLSTLRMTLAAIQQREVDERIELDDPQVLSVIEKMIKQRRESAVQYRAGHREELALREEAEIGFLDHYLPEPMSDADLDAMIAQVIADTGAGSMRDMGKVMSQIKQLAEGRADMAAVSAKVKASLSAG